MDMSAILAAISAFISGLAGKYPVLITLFAVMGGLRLIMKPLFTFLHAIADITPTQKDNQVIDTVEKSKVFSTISFILDYLASIKLQK